MGILLKQTAITFINDHKVIRQIVSQEAVNFNSNPLWIAAECRIAMKAVHVVEWCGLSILFFEFSFPHYI